jgi:uncharacterized protein YjfI (DUF2170 family)
MKSIPSSQNNLSTIIDFDGYIIFGKPSSHVTLQVVITEVYTIMDMPS